MTTPSLCQICGDNVTEMFHTMRTGIAEVIDTLSPDVTQLVFDYCKAHTECVCGCNKAYCLNCQNERSNLNNTPCRKLRCFETRVSCHSCKTMACHDRCDPCTVFGCPTQRCTQCRKMFCHECYDTCENMDCGSGNPLCSSCVVSNPPNGIRVCSEEGCKKFFCQGCIARKVERDSCACTGDTYHCNDHHECNVKKRAKIL